MESKLYEALMELLRSMSSDELYDIHTKWTDYAKCSLEDQFFSMDDFDDIMSGKTPTEIARYITMGSFYPEHCYFKFDGHALTSFVYLKYELNYDVLVRYIIDNDEDFGDGKIREALRTFK